MNNKLLPYNKEIRTLYELCKMLKRSKSMSDDRIADFIYRNVREINGIYEEDLSVFNKIEQYLHTILNLNPNKNGIY